MRKGMSEEQGMAQAEGRRARVRRRFSRKQMSALLGLLLGLLAVWGVGVYWILSDLGGMPLGVQGEAAALSSGEAEAEIQATEQPTAMATMGPTPTSTPLPMPTMVTTLGRIDPELGWSLFQGYLERLRLGDVEGANALARLPFDWDMCMAQLEEEACGEVLELAYQEGARVSRNELVHAWADENQLIMAAEPTVSQEGEGGDSHSTYVKVSLMFLRDQSGAIKFLMLRTSVWATGPTGVDESEHLARLADSDQDGLSDYEEACTENDPPCEQPTDVMEKDSDGDGFWDGIEVAGDSDPNDPGSLPD
jgi:hypothetical protein